MEQLVRVAKLLREEHDFRGYIHLKTIPEADPALIAEAGRYADRLSVNIELPTDASLQTLAPEKQIGSIKQAMQTIYTGEQTVFNEPRAPRFAPAGQSTQMIVGADPSTDRTILRLSNTLYGSYGLRRVYYSAFSPIPDASSALPLKPAPLLREHRLYQADWLLRFYGFGVEELATDPDGNLDLVHDPKLAWALENRHMFPVDINRADRETLLRIPGLGVKSVDRILLARRHRQLRMDDLARLRVSLAKVAPFLVAVDHRPMQELDSARLSLKLAPKPKQLALL